MLKLSFIFLLITSAQAATDLDMCLETCSLFAKPGHELKKCVTECVRKYADEVSTLLEAEEIEMLCEDDDEVCEENLGE